MPQTMHIPVTCLDPHYTSYNLIADKHQFLSGVQTLHDNMPSYPASNIFSCGHLPGLWPRSQRLGLEAASRRPDASPRSRLGLRRLGLGLRRLGLVG